MGGPILLGGELILLRRLFLHLARHSVQAPSALASFVG